MTAPARCIARNFSALQRAENSSIQREGATDREGRHFSALQRAENSSIHNDRRDHAREDNFSALQRAENSSIESAFGLVRTAGGFQCSSASRKFLNDPTIPQFPPIVKISVLFSEPKIPQSCWFCPYRSARSQDFSALQRAENSSIITYPLRSQRTG